MVQVKRENDADVEPASTAATLVEKDDNNNSNANAFDATTLLQFLEALREMQDVTLVGLLAVIEYLRSPTGKPMPLPIPRLNVSETR